MDLRQRILDKMAKDNGQHDWKCLKKSLALTGDGFAITYSEVAVDLALKEALREFDRVLLHEEFKSEDPDAACYYSQVIQSAIKKRLSLPKPKSKGEE